MKATIRSERPANALAVDVAELKKILGCGVTTALKVGKESGAKFKIGNRSLYRLSKIEEYLDSLTEQREV